MLTGSGGINRFRQNALHKYTPFSGLGNHEKQVKQLQMICYGITLHDSTSAICLPVI